MTDTVDAPAQAVVTAAHTGGRGLLNFAWAVEIFGIAMGVVNSGSITFGGAIPTTAGEWLLALPVAVLATFEVMRIPLTRAFQQKRRMLPRLIAFVGATLLIGIAFENWTFGLERVVNHRLSLVEPLRDELRQIQKAIADRLADNDARTERLNKDRATLQQSVADGRTQLELVARQLTAEDAAHAANLAAIRLRCMSVQELCYVKDSQKEIERNFAAKEQLQAERKQVADDLAKATGALRTLLAADTTDRAMADLRQAEAQAGVKLAREANANPVYRVAGGYYGRAPEKVTDEQLATARTFFSTFGAAIISILGTAAALVHYWPDTPGKPSKLTRAMRAYIARLRRRLVRIEKVEVPVEKIVERIVAEVEKPILVEKTIVRFVPYTGAGPLPPDESTETRIEGLPAAAALAAARSNNAKHLRVYK